MLMRCCNNTFRQKVRDQKLSTVLPEDRDRLDAQYKKIDAEYKTTQKEISVLEERNLQRIKVLKTFKYSLIKRL